MHCKVQLGTRRLKFVPHREHSPFPSQKPTGYVNSWYIRIERELYETRKPRTQAASCYGVTEHRKCHKRCQEVVGFYAINLPCTVTR